MTAQQTAVTVIEQSPDAIVEYDLDKWPVDRFNRLIPTQTLGLANDFIRPIIQVVQLDIETDTYESRDLKQGHRAPNAKGLSKLADAAGVSFVGEERLDDGSDPMRAYVRVYAEMVDPTGMKRRAPGSRDYRLDSQTMTDAQRARAKGFVHEHAATRARHRALRALLSLAQSYPVPDLQKPFAIVRFLPNLEHPEIREAFKGAMVKSIAALYGPEPARQLESGPTVQELPEVEDEPRNITPPPATPTVLPGEKLAAAAQTTDDDVPSWAQATAPVVAAEAPKAEPTLVEVIAARLKDDGAPKGPATAPQTEILQRIFGELGPEGPRIAGRGIRVLFGAEAVKALTAAQARAIGMAFDELGAKAFLDQWQGLEA